MPNVATFSPTRAQESDWASRQTATRKLYFTSLWQRVRLIVINNQHGLCCVCERPAGKGAHVDHIVPHNGDPSVFYDIANLQALCPSCHSRKTRREQTGQSALPINPQSANNGHHETPTPMGG